MQTAREGISVPEAVRSIITRNRSIYDCMRMDLINYTALAVRVQPEVERMLGGAVNLNTIVVAIKRYADRLAGERVPDGEPVLKNARVVLTDRIMDVRLTAEEFDRMGGAAEILNRFAKMGGEYEFFRISDSFRFLAEDMDGVREIFRGTLGDKMAGGGGTYSTGLARIKIVVPGPVGAGGRGARSPSDVVSRVAEILHASGIELVNAYFGQDNITIIVRDRDAARAYEALRADIARD